MRTTSVARTTTESIPRDASSLGPAIHPGEILLEEFLQPLEMTQAAAAKKLGMSTVRLNELVRGKRGVTADTALRLAQLFKTTPQLWMHMQANVDRQFLFGDQGRVAIEVRVGKTSGSWARRSESRPFAAQKVGHLRAIHSTRFRRVRPVRPRPSACACDSSCLWW